MIRYFLIDGAGDGSILLVQAAKAQECLNRWRHHYEIKSSRDVLSVGDSRPQYIANTLAKCLEWYTRRAIQKADRFRVVNTCRLIRHKFHAQNSGSFSNQSRWRV